MSTPHPRRKEILDILGNFPTITLPEMDSIRLMNRTDTKYVTSEEKLDGILSKAGESGYLAFVDSGALVHGYDSVYFDTEGLRMFLDHRNSRLVREKVRTRMYMESSLCFLEVKKKNNHSRTKKKRTEIRPEDFTDFRADDSLRSFLKEKSGYDFEDLYPSVETIFDRITLVDKDRTERVTIDTGITFKNLRTGFSDTLGDAVIIELKRDSLRRSRIKDILREERVHPMGMSKYCMGVAMTDPLCRRGRFNQKVRMIEKINRKNIEYAAAR